MKAKTVTLYFDWTGLAPDPIQYKPWNPRLTPLGPTGCVGVLIPVEIDEKWVLGTVGKGRNKKVILDARGMAFAAKSLALALDRVYKGMEK